MINGNARIENNEGHIFEGDLVNNVREGLGKYTWPNNSGVYEGRYVNGLRHTQNNEEATMRWHEGDQENIFIGKFVKGQCANGTLNGIQVNEKIPVQEEEEEK